MKNTRITNMKKFSE